MIIFEQTVLAVVSFAHIINPVTETESKNLFSAQVATFNSMIAAKKYYHTPRNVELYTVNRNENNGFIPVQFKHLPPLTRDITTVLEGEKAPLPFLKDILLALYQNSDAEFFIYSNLDIALMPYFYSAVETYIAEGHDAIIINRRRIHNKFLNEINLDILFAEAGKPHNGYDCFVFKRSLFDKFIMKDVCIGSPPAGNDLFYNIFTFAESPVLFFDKHLTFHIGLELHNDWANKRIMRYNYAQFYLMLKELFPYLEAEKFPWSHRRFFARQFIWLMNPTFHYPTMFRIDAKRKFKKTPKKEDTYKPNRKNRYLEFFSRHFYKE